MQASKYTNENKTMNLCLEEKGYRNNKSKEIVEKYVFTTSKW